MNMIKMNFQERKYELPKMNKTAGETGLVCPVCLRGALEIFRENVQIVKQEDNNSESESEGYCEGEFMYSEFRGVLVCNNRNCEKNIVFAGKFGCDDDKIDPTDGSPIIYQAIKIEYIEPPPHIIDINYSIPEKIKETLTASFKLYWIDINSCANKMRICLERIMEHFNISRSNSGKVRSLDERIKDFSRNYPRIGEILESVKWIGNVASHDDEITEKDIRDGYELLGFALGELFDKHKEDIMKIAKTINSSKEPRSKMRPSP